MYIRTQEHYVKKEKRKTKEGRGVVTITKESAEGKMDEKKVVITERKETLTSLTPSPIVSIYPFLPLPQNDHALPAPYDRPLKLCSSTHQRLGKIKASLRHENQYLNPLNSAISRLSADSGK